jgi:S1-C subfamily serine protease
MSQPPDALQDFSIALSEIIKRAAGSLVAVHSNGSRSTGFIWQPGLVVTADEALVEDGTIDVTVSGGRSLGASVIGRDPSTDVALLRIPDTALPILPLAHSDVQTGALSLAIGSKEGAPIASLGIVSFAGPGWRSLRGGEIAARIELDLRMHTSMEGGVAFDASGTAFGMVVLGPRHRVLVIPTSTIGRVAALLAKDGRVVRGYLGLGLQQVRLPDGGFGLMVMTVDPKGPGASADIRQGDVLRARDGHALRGLQDLQVILGPSGVGTDVTILISRGGQPIEAVLTIAARD